MLLKQLSEFRLNGEDGREMGLGALGLDERENGLDGFAKEKQPITGDRATGRMMVRVVVNSPLTKTSVRRISFA